ncbi:hypothetical protein ACI3ER_12130 [Bacillus sp. Wb]
MTLSVEQIEFVNNFVSGVEAYVDEETNYYGIDYIDVLEDGLQDQNISYTEEQKHEMLKQIREGLEKVYGYDNVCYGGLHEQTIPIDAQFKTVPFQLVVVK